MDVNDDLKSMVQHEQNLKMKIESIVISQHGKKLYESCLLLHKFESIVFKQNACYFFSKFTRTISPLQALNECAACLKAISDKRVSCYFT